MPWVGGEDGVYMYDDRGNSYKTKMDDDDDDDGIQFVL